MAIDTSAWPEKVLSLFCMLAAEPDKRCRRDDVIDRLWPDSSPEAGASNFRRTLHFLRRGLGGGDPTPVLLERQWILLNPDFDWMVDLDRLAELFAAEQDPGAWEEAASLVESEPLAEQRYDDWAMHLRERVDRQAGELLLRLGRWYRGRGDAATAERWFRRALERDPLDEEGLRGLVDALVASGNRAGAIREYRRFEQQMREDLGVEPSAETRALFVGVVSASEPSVSASAVDSSPPQVPGLPDSDTLLVRSRQVALQTLVGRLQVRGASLTLLVGEPGMGKSHILQEAERAARSRGGIALSGRCFQHEGRLPYGPLHDALLTFSRTADRERLESLCHDLLSDLVHVVPELRSMLGRATTQGERPDPRDGRLQAFAAVASLLNRLSAEAPVLLALEDIHWADDTTIQLMHYISRQPVQGTLAVVATLRTDMPPALRNVVETASLASPEGVDARVIALHALDRAELSELCRQELQGPCADELLVELQVKGAGNPLFSRQILRFLQQQRVLERDVGGWKVTSGRVVIVPPEVTRVVAERIAHLGRSERQVAILVAILGDAAPAGVLESMWDGQTDALFSSLDALVRADIVTEEADGYRFVHALVQAGAYSLAPRPQRPVLHERAARALETVYSTTRGEHAAQIGNQYLLAGSQFKHRAYHFLVQAAEVAEGAYAWEQALELYRQARTCSADAGTARLHERCAELLALLAHFRDAIESLDLALSYYRGQNDAGAAARVLARMGHLYYRGGESAAGLDRIRLAIETLPVGVAAVETSALHAARARLAWSVGSLAEALEAARMAASLARDADDMTALRAAEVWEGLCRSAMGDQNGALTVLEPLIENAEREADPEALYVSLTIAGEVHLILGVLAATEALWQRALTVAQSRHDRNSTAFALVNMSHLRFLQGRWDEARDVLADAETSMADSGDAWSATYLPMTRGWYLLERDCCAPAAEELERALQLAMRTADWQARVEILALLAEIDVRQGRAAEAVQRLETVCASIDEPDEARLRAFPSLALALLESGDVERAEAVVARGLGCARDWNHALVMPHLVSVQGRIMARRGRHGEADRLLSWAVRMASELGIPHLEARALREQEEACRVRGDAQGAEEARRRANTLMEGLARAL